MLAEVVTSAVTASYFALYTAYSKKTKKLELQLLLDVLAFKYLRRSLVAN